MKKLQTNISRLHGELTVPGDKSITHRAIMLGALAKGITTIYHFAKNADCFSTVHCFQEMGVSVAVNEDKLIIKGIGLDRLQEPEQVLNVGNSGTTIRLLLGILSTAPFNSVLIGDDSIANRPMNRVIEPLRKMGAKIEGRALNYTPITVQGRHLHAIDYKSNIASAQVKSAILLAGLYANGVTTLTEPYQSRDHTERMFGQFGVDIHISAEKKISVQGKQILQPTTIHVPGDISSAAFFLVAGTIVPNSVITLKNVGLNPTRSGILDVLEMMGADVQINVENEENEPFGDITIATSSLKSDLEISGAIIPRLIDEIPLIALLATQATGKTVIKDASELKVKETNRIKTVVTELTKLGATIEETDDGMIIYGKTSLSAENAVVDSHGDHRIGMMLAIASLITSGTVQLDNEEAISVSYPNFFVDLINFQSE